MTKSSEVRAPGIAIITGALLGSIFGAAFGWVISIAMALTLIGSLVIAARMVRDAVENDLSE